MYVDVKPVSANLRSNVKITINRLKWIYCIHSFFLLLLLMYFAVKYHKIYMNECLEKNRHHFSAK